MPVENGRTVSIRDRYAPQRDARRSLNLRKICTAFWLCLSLSAEPRLCSEGSGSQLAAKIAICHGDEVAELRSDQGKSRRVAYLV